ncbi:MAG TPA: hypothetical protein ENN17_07025 [bacterium]|nr:hypothetical protein [bacterium]
MKMLKNVLNVLIVLIAGFLIIAAFLPDSYHVEHSVRISQPADSVYDYLIDHRNRRVWDPWIEREPDAVLVLSGPRTGVGASWTWEGRIIGSGSMTIVAVDTGRSIQSRLRFTSPRQSEADIFWLFQPLQDGTEVRWTIEGKLRYPFERFAGLFFERMIGPDFERGLDNLKTVLESGLTE